MGSLWFSRKVLFFFFLVIGVAPGFCLKDIFVLVGKMSPFVRPHTSSNDPSFALHSCLIVTQMSSRESLDSLG